MKRRFAHGLVLAAMIWIVGSASSIALADDAPKTLGDWALKVMTDDGQTLASTLKLSQKDGKLAGTFVGMDGTEVKAEDITAKDDELAFTVKLDFQGTELVAKFKLKKEGEALKGSVDYDLGGQSGTLDVTGARPATGGKIDEGTWNLEIQTDDGQTLKAAVKLAKDGDKLTGSFTGVDGTEAKLNEASMKDGELAFKVTLDFQGSELVAKFKLKNAESGAKGTVDYDLGGQTGTLDVIAKRPGGGAGAAGGAIGKWDLEVTTDDGQTLKSSIKLAKDGDKVGGQFIAPDGKEVKLEDVKLDGNDVAFTVNVDFEGTALNAKFKGKMDGDALKGQVDYDLGGQTGTLDFKGKRSADAK
ncbi:MAG: hypothetical protein HYX69_22785 [Planctomycetia bacterium]|nr:hypothetical protein [Planctomycetia bacterium]